MFQTGNCVGLTFSSNVQPNTTYQITLQFSIPPGARQGFRPGMLQISEGWRPLPKALGINLNVSYDQNTISPTTAVLSPQTVQFLSSISPDRSTLTFSQATPELSGLSEGNVLILGDSPTSPGGFIGRITSISQSGTDVIIVTVPASLADALTSANISISRTLTAADVASASMRRTLASSATQTASGFSLAFNHVLLYDNGAGGQV